MNKIDKKLEELLAKHPSLTKPKAIEILTNKNERKKKKRLEKAEKSNAQKLRNEANRPNVNEEKSDEITPGEGDTENR